MKVNWNELKIEHKDRMRMHEILFCFIHLEAITHIDKEQTTTTIINKSNNSILIKQR